MAKQSLVCFSEDDLHTVIQESMSYAEGSVIATTASERPGDEHWSGVGVQYSGQAAKARRLIVSQAACFESELGGDGEGTTAETWAWCA